MLRRDGAGDGLVEHAVKESLRRGHNLLGEGRDVVRRLGRVAGEHGSNSVATARRYRLWWLKKTIYSQSSTH